MFRESPPRAGKVGAQKAARADQQRRGTALPWQVLQPALVLGVNAGGGLAAAGTVCRRGPRLGDDRDPVGRGHDPLDREAGRDQRQNALCQGSPVVAAGPEDGNLASRPPSLHAKRGRARNARPTSSESAGRRSGGLQHALAQELEAGTPVHRPLDRLEPVHLAFDRARRPRQLERRLHRLDLPPQAGREAGKR
jgi:hypothetical protein